VLTRWAVAGGAPALLGCLALTAATVPATATADDWAQLGRTPTHLNRIVDGALGRGQSATLHVAFTGTYGLNATSEAGAVAASGVAYIPGFDGNVTAFSLAGCGAAQCPSLWTGHTENGISATPAVADGVLVVASADRFVYGFPAAGCGRPTCKPLWQAQMGDADVDSSVVVDRGTAYVGGYDGHLYAFAVRGCGRPLCGPLWVGRASDGCGLNHCKPLWRGDLDGEVVPGTPAVADLRGCGADDCLPLAFVQVAESGFYLGSPVAVADGHLLFGAGDNDEGGASKLYVLSTDATP
jgi:outer membrane protein assembly factor BamB